MFYSFYLNQCSLCKCFSLATPAVYKEKSAAHELSRKNKFHRNKHCIIRLGT